MHKKHRAIPCLFSDGLRDIETAKNQLTELLNYGAKLIPNDIQRDLQLILEDIESGLDNLLEWDGE